MEGWVIDGTGHQYNAIQEAQYIRDKLLPKELDGYIMDPESDGHAKAGKGSMRRFLIFSLGAPVLGVLAVLVGSLSVAGHPNWSFLLIIVMFTFFIGTVPALLTGTVDWLLASKLTFLPRIVATDLAGYLITVLAGLLMF